MDSARVGGIPLRGVEGNFLTAGMCRSVRDELCMPLMTDRPYTPLLMTADETAELLRKSRKAVYLMVSRGQLPGVTRIGRRLLLRRDDLLAWLDESRAPSPKE